MTTKKVTVKTVFQFIGAFISCIIWLPFSSILFLIWTMTKIESIQQFNEWVNNLILDTFDMEIEDIDKVK